MVPRDTLGNVLPIPVPAEKICRVPQSDWMTWWMRGGPPWKQEPCCQCGEWKYVKVMAATSMKYVHNDVKRRKLNTSLMAIYLCKNCKDKCSTCKAIIPNAQKQARGGRCEVCNAA